MIRLDGNNLAAFRGAGVAGTVQSVAGCELFGEARGTSPYSAAATAALKDAFSAAQWATIRDYGFAHPALVPFINEDPMLVCSLMELGKIRYLKGDGASWIDMGIKLGTGTKTLIKFKYSKNPVGNKSLVAGVGCQQVHYNNNTAYYQYAGNWNAANTAFVKDTVYEVETNFGSSQQHMKINGTIKKTTSSGGTQSPSTNTFVFSAGSDGSSAEFDAEFCKAWSGDTLIKEFVPFVSTNRNGMLDIHDLEHPVFHENKGSGTFGTEITDSPA